MKFINYSQFIDDLTRVAAAREAHHEYVGSLIEQNQVWAAGPLMDRKGVLFIYEAPDLASAEAIIHSDPFFTKGVIASYELHPWDARVLNSELPPLSRGLL